MLVSYRVIENNITTSVIEVYSWGLREVISEHESFDFPWIIVMSEVVIPLTECVLSGMNRIERIEF